MYFNGKYIEYTNTLINDSTKYGETFDTLRMVASSPFGLMTSWETSDGDVVKGELPLGMAMFLESKQVAMNMASAMPSFSIAGVTASGPSDYKPPSDFAMATAIV